MYVVQQRSNKSNAGDIVLHGSVYHERNSPWFSLIHYSNINNLEYMHSFILNSKGFIQISYVFLYYRDFKNPIKIDRLALLTLKILRNHL